MDYQKRIIDDLLVRHLASAGAVVLQGPRAVGKTRSAQQFAKSEVFLDVDPNARLAMGIDPTLVLEGARPRLLDEWQEFPELWNFVRRAVDASTSPGQFLLTGSALPITNERLHTGAGRFSALTLRPMSLFELGQSTAAVSFAELARGGEVRSPACVFTLRDVAEALVRGGWPALRSLGLDDAARANRDYLDIIRRVDVQRVTGSRRDPERLRRLLISLARNASTQVTLRTLADDVGGDDTPLAQDTLRAYLNALRQLFILEDLEAWSPRVRSRTTLRSAPKTSLRRSVARRGGVVVERCVISG